MSNHQRPDRCEALTTWLRTSDLVAVIRVVALVFVTFSITYVGYGRFLSRFVDP